MVFPVDGQARLLSEVSSAEVVDFVNYFLSLHKYADSRQVTHCVCFVLRFLCVVCPLMFWLLDRCPPKPLPQEEAGEGEVGVGGG